MSVWRCGEGVVCVGGCGACAKAYMCIRKCREEAYPNTYFKYKHFLN